MDDFESELQRLINRYSVENRSDTPDYILVEYIGGCLEAFRSAVLARDSWHGFTTWPKQPDESKNSSEGNERNETSSSTTGYTTLPD
jgi:hypothetical protein